MDAIEPWYVGVSFPALLRASRNAYRHAIHVALADAGCDDVPANGVFVIGGIARTGAPLAEIIGSLGVSKQAAGQLVDTLVARGYLERAIDPVDRRRLTISLTERGAAAAAVIRAAVDSVDDELATRVGADHVLTARAALAELVAIAHEHAHERHEHGHDGHAHERHEHGHDGHAHERHEHGHEPHDGGGAGGEAN